MRQMQTAVNGHWKLLWAGALFSALVTFLLYLPALQNGFVNWDDPTYVYENAAIRNLSPELIKWAFTSLGTTKWQPLTMVSFALDYAVWGLNPLGFHLTNVVFHALNTLLVFLLAARIIEFANAGTNREKIFITTLVASTLTALLFGIHPKHVESVAWVTERKDVLSGFFFLLSLHAYLGYAAADSKKPAFYGASLFLFALALMSKSMAVTLPAVLLILDFHPLKRLKGKAVLLEKVPFIILGIFASVLTVWANLSAKAVVALDVYPLGTRILNALHSSILYLYKMAVPVDLAPYYPYPEDISLLGSGAAASVIVFTAITAFAIVSMKRTRLYLALWLYYIVTLTPVMGIIQVGSQAGADRFTYLPSLGPFLLAGLGFGLLYAKCSKKQLVPTIAVVVLILTTLALKTMDQTRIWKNSVTLWTHEIEIFPDSIHPGYHLRALAYFRRGEYREAAKDYDKAVKIDPGNPEVYLGRGSAYGKLGRYHVAINDYDTAIKLDPSNADYYNKRGVTYGRLGKYPSAIRDFERVIELNPGHIDAYKNLGTAYSITGDMRRSAFYFEKAALLEKNGT